MADSLTLPTLVALFVLALTFARPFDLPRGPRGPWSA
jgi:hypothetical protein